MRNWYKIIFVILFFPLQTFSQTITYEVDTMYLPRKIFERKYPTKKLKHCFDIYGNRIVCSYSPWEKIILKHNKLFIYRVLQLSDTGYFSYKNFKGAFQIKCYELNKEYAELFDTVIYLKYYYPPPKYLPCCLGDSAVLLVGYDIAIYNYKSGYFRSRYEEELAKKNKRLTSVPFHYSYCNQPFRRDGKFYLGFLYPTRMQANKWYKSFKPLVLSVINGMQIIYIDTMGMFPKCGVIENIKHAANPWLNPMVFVDTSSADEEVYLSFPASEYIDVYDTNGNLLRKLSKFSSGDTLVPITFYVYKDYVIFTTNKYGLLRGWYLKVIDKKTGKELGRLKADANIRRVYETGIYIGYRDYNEECFIDEANLYSNTGNSTVPVYVIRFNVKNEGDFK